MTTIKKARKKRPESELKLASIIARVLPEDKAKFQRVAKAGKMKESELLRSMIQVVLDESEQPKTSEPEQQEEAEPQRIMLRLPAFLMTATKKAAKAKWMVPGRYVSALVQSNLMADPVMTEAEVLALQASNRELAAIGRNLNQIAKALNESFYETDRLKMETLKELTQAIKSNQQEIRALVRATKRGWGSEET